MIDQLRVLAVAVVPPLVLGAGVLRAIGFDLALGRRAFAAYAYLIGQLVLAPFTLLWLATGKVVPGLSLPVAAIVIGAVAWLRHRKARERERARPVDWPMAITAMLCCAWLIDGFLAVNMAPITNGDEGLIWNAKARVLGYAPDFGIAMGLSYHVGHAAYPLLNPLVQVLADIGHSGMQAYESRIPIQGFAIALILLLSAALSRLPRLLGIGLCVAFLGCGVFVGHAPWACADVLEGLALLGAAIAYLRFEESGQVKFWRLMCLSLAAVVAAKNEGLMLVLVFALAHCLRVLAGRLRRPATTAPSHTPGGRRGLNWLWLAVPLAALAGGQWFNSHYGLVTDLVDPAKGNGMGLVERSLRNLPERGATVVGHYARSLASSDSRWLVLMALVVGTVHVVRWPRHAMATVQLTLVGALLGYVLVFVGTPNPLLWHLETAVDRTLLQITPIAVLVLGYAAAGMRPHERHDSIEGRGGVVAGER
ncbi:MAG: hypothetical protein KDC98_16085 [Planctomycetes bacterium]|nr:hypothetical protein [Planctomycetota bacterium]